VTTEEIALRVAVAVGLGAVIGIDRELRDHPAGLRTHMLTALAAAVFTMLAFEIYEVVLRDAALGSARGIPDPIRAIEAVTAGVAFLAAGGIIHARGRVDGLTTGAGMWTAGAIGVACGAGFFRIALIATVGAIAILTVVSLLQRSIARWRAGYGAEGRAARSHSPEP
jgi:putative Mg2+ transporter-C (MgtC) family protein